MSEEKEPIDRQDLSPYLTLLLQQVRGSLDTKPLIACIRDLPDDRRYIYRIVSSLRLAFQDFDSMTVGIDAETLPVAKLQEIVFELERRKQQLEETLKILKSNAG
jgi:hypothetical protein